MVAEIEARVCMQTSENVPHLTCGHYGVMSRDLCSAKDF